MRTICEKKGQATLFVELTLAVAICPDCDQVSSNVHDLSEVQMVRDLAIAERRWYLIYHLQTF
jgi:transposase